MELDAQQEHAKASQPKPRRVQHHLKDLDIEAGGEMAVPNAITWTQGGVETTAIGSVHHTGIVTCTCALTDTAPTQMRPSTRM